MQDEHIDTESACDQAPRNRQQAHDPTACPKRLYEQCDLSELGILVPRAPSGPAISFRVVAGLCQGSQKLDAATNMQGCHKHGSNQLPYSPSRAAPDSRQGRCCGHTSHRAQASRYCDDSCGPTTQVFCGASLFIASRRTALFGYLAIRSCYKTRPQMIVGGAPKIEAVEQLSGLCRCSLMRMAKPVPTIQLSEGANHAQH